VVEGGGEGAGDCPVPVRRMAISFHAMMTGESDAKLPYETGGRASTCQPLSSAVLLGMMRKVIML
jgi:hypothetical protein